MSESAKAESADMPDAEDWIIDSPLDVILPSSRNGADLLQDVEDISLADLVEYGLFNRHGMLRRPYPTPEFPDPDAVLRPMGRPCDMELCLSYKRRQEDGEFCLPASIPDEDNSDSAMSNATEIGCDPQTSLSVFRTSLFGRHGMLRLGFDRNRERIRGAPSELEVILGIRADIEDRRMAAALSVGVDPSDSASLKQG
jgi:hypothetical protein